MFRINVLVKVEEETTIELTEEQAKALLNGETTLENLFTADLYFGPMGDSLGKEDLGGRYEISVKEVGKDPGSVEIYSSDSYSTAEEARESGGNYTSDVPNDPREAFLAGMTLAQQCLGSESIMLAKPTVP